MRRDLIEIALEGEPAILAWCAESGMSPESACLLLARGLAWTDEKERIEAENERAYLAEKERKRQLRDELGRCAFCPARGSPPEPLAQLAPEGPFMCRPCRLGRNPR